MSVSTLELQEIVGFTPSEQDELDALLRQPSAGDTTVLPAASPRRWSLGSTVLVILAFVAAGIAAAFCARSAGFIPAQPAQPAYAVTTTIVPAHPAAPIIHKTPASKSRVVPVVSSGIKVAAVTGTAVVTRPASGTQNQAQPDPVTKPQPKPASGNGQGTTTATGTGSAPPPAVVPPTTGGTSSSGGTTTTTVTVVNSSPDGSGTTGDAVNDQGTGDTSTGSQMPTGTGPGDYNSGGNAGPSF